MPKELTVARRQRMTYFWRVVIPTSSLIVEYSSEMIAIGENVRLIRKVGAAGINKVDAR